MDIANPGGITEALVMGIFLSLLIWREVDFLTFRRSRLLLLVMIILMGIVVILGLSRKTIAAAILSMLTIAVFRSGMENKVKFLLLFFVAVVVAGFISYQLMPQALSHRLDETFGVSLEETTSGRTYYWKAAWINLLNHPFIGTGAKSFRHQYRESLWMLVGQSRSKVVHSMYLQVLAEQGILGFVPLTLFIVSLFAFGLSGTEDKDLFMAAVVFLTIMWIAASPINSPIYFVIGIFAKRLLEDGKCDHRESY